MAHGRHTRRTFIARGAAAGAAVAASGLWLPASGALGSTTPRRGGVWLPGDLHTHSTYSHDVYGGPTDDNTGPDQAYTLGLPVAGKFLEGRERGLRYMAVSDHNDIRSFGDLASGNQGLIAIPAYEHSIQGHAQMLGAKRQQTSDGLYPAGDQAADVINAMANALRSDGGLFQANHPAYRVASDAQFHACSASGGCQDCQSINWTYGFDVQPDTIEVWNPSVVRSDISETFWECWLDRGVQVGGTGGSDSHWLSLHAVAGPGQPTTWVYASEASPAGILQGLREGRTVVSGQPPELNGAQVFMTHGGAMIGDTVAPGSKIRVTVPNLALPGLVRIRANGQQILEREIDPGGSFTFRAPREAGWVRAILLARQSVPVDTAVSNLGDATPQRDGMPLLSLSSPMYLRRPSSLAA